MVNNMHKMKKDKYNVNLANDLKLERINMNDTSKSGYNYVGTEYNWTTIEEQKMKVNEIEQVTRKKK